MILYTWESIIVWQDQVIWWFYSHKNIGESKLLELIHIWIVIFITGYIIYKNPELRMAAVFYESTYDCS
jgi:hypothetical protein